MECSWGIVRRKTELRPDTDSWQGGRGGGRGGVLLLPGDRHLISVGVEVLFIRETGRNDGETLCFPLWSVFWNTANIQVELRLTANVGKKPMRRYIILLSVVLMGTMHTIVSYLST